MINLKKLIRKNIQNLTPYSSARDEFKKSFGIFLDANENSIGSISDELLNRYPDPHQLELKEKIAKINSINSENIFFGNGSDEAIDLLVRTFCEPKTDKIMLFPPTYGMYKVVANINDVGIVEIPLTKDFQLNTEKIISEFDDNLKIIFICSPNNPTGNVFKRNDIENILNKFNGIVVIDEAYIHFCKDKSFLNKINEFDNLVILQTFSKALGMANIRLGMAFANPQIISILNKIKYPYNVNGVTQNIALKSIENITQSDEFIKTIINEKIKMVEQLSKLQIVENIFHSDANFLLVRFINSQTVFKYLLQNQIIVRDRSKEINCENCLRITIGKPKENEKLITALKKYVKTQGL